jgi:hypothetical protein
MQFQKGDIVDLAVTDPAAAAGRFEVVSVTGDKVKIRDRQSKKVGTATPADLRLYMRFGGPSGS